MRAAIRIARLCVVVSGCHAVEARDEPAGDGEADQLLRAMTKTLAEAKELQFDADHVLETITKNGEVLQFVAESRVAVKRPDKLRSDRGPMADTTLYYDGKSLTLFGKRSNVYSQAPAPDNLDEAIALARDTLALEAPATDLLYTNAYERLMAGVTTSTYIGLEPVGDRMCHHLAYRARENDWQIWIENGPDKLPCRYVIVRKTVKGSPRLEVTFRKWDLSPNFSDAWFEIEPPQNAMQIDLLQLKRKPVAHR